MIAHRINAERLTLLGWSRAILLQLAHPLVAAGVFEHSAFRAGPFAAARRLHLTVRAMLALTFGDERGRAQALEGILAIHRRVRGTLATATGRFPAGTPYSAEDPALVLWVHATLLDSIPLAYGEVVAPLSPADRDAYCVEAAAVAIDLGARSDEVPRTWGALRGYLEGMYASGAIAVGPQARELAGAVLAPPFAPLVAPAAWANRVMTIGWLPGDIRRQYGFEWTARDARWHGRLTGALRAARRLMPGVIAQWPESRAPHHRSG